MTAASDLERATQTAIKNWETIPTEIGRAE